MERAKKAYKALELDETLAEAHVAISFFKGCKEWDYPGAGRAVRRALQLNPGLAEAHVAYAQYLSIFGTEEEAMAEWKRGTDLDPMSPLYRAWFAGACWEFGRFEEAVMHARKALELHADFPVALAVLGWGLFDSGHPDDAIATHERAASIHSKQGFSWVLAAPMDWRVALRTEKRFSSEQSRTIKAISSIRGSSPRRTSPWVTTIERCGGSRPLTVPVFCSCRICAESGPPVRHLRYCTVTGGSRICCVA